MSGASRRERDIEAPAPMGYAKMKNILDIIVK
jgi:hypothetical protein